MVPRSMHRLLPIVLLAATLSAPGCNEDGTVKVNSLKFNGVTSVDVTQLKNALATRERAKVPILNVRFPWMKGGPGFDRSRFDADLKRIEAFYADRGFPDARVTG